MPLPAFAAAASLAAVVGATHDCEPHDEEEKQQQPRSFMPDCSEHLPEDPPAALQAMRSMDGDPSSMLLPTTSSAQSNGAVKLRTASTSAHNKQANNGHGFVNGSFASGMTNIITTDDECFVLGYSSNLLAVGTSEGLDLFETQNYSAVFRIQCRDMVSVIRWFEPTTATGTVPSQRLLAFGCLDGSCYVYLVDVELLEVEGGVSLLHHFRMKGQVRALAGCYFEGTAVVAVGDKTGAIVMVSFDEQNEHIASLESKEHRNPGVLALDLHGSRGWLVSGTRTGDTKVYPLCRNQLTGAVSYEKAIWRTERNGPVRAVAFSHGGQFLALGGYDKYVVLVDTSVWAVFRDLEIHGTINALAFDPFDRYLAVGSRDRSLSLFDTSTFMEIKVFHTAGWVTDLSWGRAENADVLAVRSDVKTTSVLNLQPITLSNIRLFSSPGMESSLSWSEDGRFLARSVDNLVVVVDAMQHFKQIAIYQLTGDVVRTLFIPKYGTRHVLAVIDDSGYLTMLVLRADDSAHAFLERHLVSFVELGLKALACSTDGSILALGGKEKLLHLLDTNSLASVREAIDMEAKIWDIAFNRTSTTDDQAHLAVALDDYTSVVLDKSFEYVLRILRPRTVRCLDFDHQTSLLAVGDAAGTVAIVDPSAAEVLHEINAGGRVNVVSFSPAGDFLLVGTDNGSFKLYTSSSYQCVQEIPCAGFALCANFSHDGVYLALGNAGGSYFLVRLGPLLGIELVPLSMDREMSELPSWALTEVLFRSGHSSTFLQRQMMNGGQENLRHIGTILKEYPDAVYTFNRETRESFFDTALELGRPNLLKLVITALVDGTLDCSDHHQQSVLTTGLPLQAKNAILAMLNGPHPELAIEILGSVSFMKVPYANTHKSSEVRIHEKGSSDITDPWGSAEEESTQHVRALFRQHASKLTSLRQDSFVQEKSHEKMLTPAVLPLPGLGDMEFLSALRAGGHEQAFDNDAMAVVLRVLWENHIRCIFYLDLILYFCFYGVWIALVELHVGHEGLNDDMSLYVRVLSICLLSFNTLFCLKEIIEARYGGKSGYFASFWNGIDVLTLACVYIFSSYVFLSTSPSELPVTLAVVTTLAMTIKFISYLRAFTGTGWLISVLCANFQDVRGFLFILSAIVVGFGVIFRILFEEVDDESFGTLRRSLLSTFELVVIGSYEREVLFKSSWGVLAVATFVLAVTCVLVVALNALISVLADSYARVQQNATANRRKEQAGLIVEYMSLLPPSARKNIESSATWMHALLEVDSDGSLVKAREDWKGGLNSLKQEMEDLSKRNRVLQEKSLAQTKTELIAEVAAFRKETTQLLNNLTAEVENMRRAQSRGGITLSGKNVRKAVRAVKAIGKKAAELYKE